MIKSARRTLCIGDVVKLNPDARETYHYAFTDRGYRETVLAKDSRILEINEAVDGDDHQVLLPQVPFPREISSFRREAQFGSYLVVSDVLEKISSANRYRLSRFSQLETDRCLDYFGEERRFVCDFGPHYTIESTPPFVFTDDMLLDQHIHIDLR